MFTTVTPSGGTVQSGGTPFTAQVPQNAVCAVQVQNYQNFIFSFWSDGNTDSPRNVVATQNMTLIAVLGTNGLPIPPAPPAGMATLIYGTKNTLGSMFGGMFVTMSWAGTVTTRFSPTYVYVPIGASVTITPTTAATDQNTGIVSTFARWEDSTTAPQTRTIAVSGNMTLIAVYSQAAGTVAVGMTGDSLLGATSGFR